MAIPLSSTASTMFVLPVEIPHAAGALMSAPAVPVIDLIQDESLARILKGPL